MRHLEGRQYDHLDFDMRRDCARVVNRFAPGRHRFTAATIAQLTPMRIDHALYLAERYAINHSHRPLLVTRQRAESLRKIVRAIGA